MRASPRFAVGDKIWAGHHELSIYFAGCWWDAPMRGVVKGYDYCEGAKEWFYVVAVECAKLDVVFPEHDIKFVNVLQVMAEATADWLRPGPSHAPE